MKIVVGISDMKVSNNPEDVLITYSLGSCIGVVIWDPVAKVAGLLHYMLPDSSLDKEKAQLKPFMFADTGIPRLFKETYKYGAAKSRLVVKVVGGSQIMDSSGIFNIGKRNYAVLRKMFWKNHIMVTAEDVGESGNRTVSIEVDTGRTMLKVSGRGEFEL
ncbi:chemotaxis protein CheD [Desulfurivibrio dismutans]|uniref:chemotaxis protein CheD n=1 Tax=Desulfurivibrio dismutans TaxID=1398908 RepID=UPI0023DC57A3|nr:chemotaxis protein CheD [Desulfurivibrio alkaliphilus]MDF1615172.1 chemotaxis protein CheD [Desulfurivibrio alkaliphilus]